MNAPTLGRCQCPKCKDPSHSTAIFGGPCPLDAVRMVTVRVENYTQARRDDPHGQHEYDVPLCAPCAEYAEAKVTR